jgi:vancomycin resistance protein YoaR
LHQLFFRRTGLYLTLFLSLSAANILAVDAALNSDTHILPAVRVGDTDIGGLTIDDARTALRKSVPFYLTPLRITFEDKQWLIESTDIELAVDELETAQTAYLQPRQGHLLRRFIALHTIHDVKPALYLNEEKLAILIKAMSKEVYVAAKPASIRYDDNGGLVIIPGSKGRKLDDSSLHAVRNALFNAQASIDLTARDVEPAVTETDLQHINSIIAEYRTEFNSEETARNQNILLAANSLDATLLRPGESLSFNAVVGPRSEQRGYRKAPAYVNEKQLVDDWGGGICQVSSTLYNAALLADLTIVERAAHFRPAGYVPIGLDATIDFDSKLDLKITNPLHDSVYISVETKVNQLIVKVLGKSVPDKPKVQIVTTNFTALEPKTVIIQDPTLDPGVEIMTQAGQKGFHVSTARVRSANGQELSRELLADDTYKPVDKIVRVGIRTNGKAK